MPVAVPEVDRQLDTVAAQLAFERGDQRPVLGVDRADAAKMRVVTGDFFEPFAWNIAAAGDVFQKWHDVVHALGTTERKYEERVVRACGIVKERRARSL